MGISGEGGTGSGVLLRREWVGPVLKAHSQSLLLEERRRITGLIQVRLHSFAVPTRSTLSERISRPFGAVFCMRKL